jgi:MarR family transcriptional regulator, organic hydroperoxide resistance regulator
VSHPELLLSNQLCFLVHRLDRAIGAQYRPLLARLGITYPQYLAMLALWEKETLEVGQLCTMLDLDTGTVSPLLKRLEAQGLVARQRRKDDERMVTVSLTPAGKALETHASSIPGTLASCLLAGPEEHKELMVTLSGLLSRLDRATYDPTCGIRSPDRLL